MKEKKEIERERMKEEEGLDERETERRREQGGRRD